MRVATLGQSGALALPMAGRGGKMAFCPLLGNDNFVCYNGGARDQIRKWSRHSCPCHPRAAATVHSWRNSRASYESRLDLRSRYARVNSPGPVWNPYLARWSDRIRHHMHWALSLSLPPSLFLSLSLSLSLNAWWKREKCSSQAQSLCYAYLPSFQPQRHRLKGLSAIYADSRPTFGLLWEVKGWPVSP